MAICTMFGGYSVTGGQVCDSFERGRPGSEGMKGNKPTRPHNLHESAGKNHCRECTYFKTTGGKQATDDKAKYALSR